MNEKALKNFLRNKVYKRICEHSKTDKIFKSEIIEYISFVRIDKTTGDEFIKMLEDYGFITVLSRGRIKLNNFEKIKFEDNTKVFA